MTDRAMFKWKRLSTPAAGEGRASRVAWLGFPTDYLSKPSNSDLEGVAWIAAAPSGGATYVEFAFTRESQETIQTAFRARQERILLAYVELPSGEAFLADCYHAGWENRDLNVPGNGKVADLVFSSRDPWNTGKPVRIRFGRAPSDGDALVLQELGGYADPATPNPALQGTRDKAARP